MLSENVHASPSPIQPTCYFTIQPSRSSSISSETPIYSPAEYHYPETPSEPSNPLLALRETPSVFPLSDNMSSTAAANLLQLQTTAAYSPSRPMIQPLQQNVLDVSDDSTTSRASTDSSSSSTSTSRGYTSHIVRCSRCQRDGYPGDGRHATSGMVSFGTNLHYCKRCASLVGYYR